MSSRLGFEFVFLVLVGVPVDFLITLVCCLFWFGITANCFGPGLICLLSFADSYGWSNLVLLIV